MVNTTIKELVLWIINQLVNGQGTRVGGTDSIYKAYIYKGISLEKMPLYGTNVPPF